VSPCELTPLSLARVCVCVCVCLLDLRKPVAEEADDAGDG
jgi:hypothetical protein